MFLCPQLPLTQEKHTSYPSHQIIIQCHMYCTYWVHFGGSCPLGPYSSSVLLQLASCLRMCLHALHIPSDNLSLATCWAQLRKQGRGENKAQPRRGGSLAALSWEKFNVSFSLPPSGQATLIAILFKFCLQCCIISAFLLLVTLIQSTFSCLKGWSGQLDQPMH